MTADEFTMPAGTLGPLCNCGRMHVAIVRGTPWPRCSACDADEQSKQIGIENRAVVERIKFADAEKAAKRGERKAKKIGDYMPGPDRKLESAGK